MQRRGRAQIRFGHPRPGRRGVWQACLLLAAVLACNIGPELRDVMSLFAVLSGLFGGVAALAALFDRRVRPDNFRQDVWICQVCVVIIIGVLLGLIPGALAV